MKTSKDYIILVNNINSDVETAIAKILMKNTTIKKVFDKDIHIGRDSNNVNCVWLDNKKVMFLPIEENIKVLEELENIVDEKNKYSFEYSENV